MTHRSVTLVAATVLSLLLASACAQAQVPTKMNYQVMLTDDADQPLADTAVQIVFRLYTAPSGGSLEWTETHNTTTNSIGVVSVVLGETTPLEVGDFDQPLWLEVQVGGETLTPRRELVSAAYSLHSQDSDYLGGAQASDYALDSDLVGVGDGHSLDASDGSPVNQVYVNADGNVGIGTTTPNEDVHVHDGTGLVYQRFTNSTTGTGTSDGFKIGVNGAGNAYIYQYEAADINFVTNGLYRGRFAADGAFELGNNLVTGSLKLYENGSTDPVATLGTYSSLGGALELLDANGYRHAYLEPDITGGGAGFMQVCNTSGAGFVVNGNSAIGSDCEVVAYGSASASAFYAGASGDDSVVLPTGSVSATETKDEPGAAGTLTSSAFGLTGGYDTLLSRTITAPAAGYVFAIATAEAYCSGGSTNAASFGVSMSPSGFPGAGAVYARLPDTAGAGNWYFPITVHGVFEVSAGSTTFYFLGDGVLGDWTVSDRKLSLIYVPTAYGTVTRAESGDAGDPETGIRATGGPMTDADLAFERAESIAANQARVDAELAAMRAELAELRAQLQGQNGRD